jgi:hypothetical protein
MAFVVDREWLRARVVAERAEQGLPPTVQSPEAAERAASLLRLGVDDCAA